MQELIKINSKPAALNVNFDELKAHLSKELEKYDVLVTAETLPDCKKLATELNKMAKIIDDTRKAEVAKVSIPIKEFDGNMKELSKICLDGRQKLLVQTQVFEDETRKKVAELLKARRARLFEEHGIEAEFQSAEFDDLIIISNMTPSGGLSSKARSELASRVMADKLLQEQTGKRLALLEAASHKANLTAPLDRRHVERFLFLDDETYNVELQRVIDAELERQEATEAAMRAKLEEEAKAKEEEQKRESEQMVKPEPEIEEAKPEPSLVNHPDPARKPGQEPGVEWQITCSFDITTMPHITPDQIRENLKLLMANAGFKSLSSIQVIRKRGEIGKAS